jgi:hypothetical protein
MVELKAEFPDEYEWVLPISGDWHPLLNTQPVLKKIFLDAGLVKLAEKMGFANGIGALVESKNFDRNHLFLIEAWEGMYRAFLEMFLKEKVLHLEAITMEEIEARLGETEEDIRRER